MKMNMNFIIVFSKVLKIVIKMLYLSVQQVIINLPEGRTPWNPRSAGNDARRTDARRTHTWLFFTNLFKIISLFNCTCLVWTIIFELCVKHLWLSVDYILSFTLTILLKADVTGHSTWDIRDARNVTLDSLVR